MNDLRIVKGNTFSTVMKVRAQAYSGEEIANFDLQQCTNLKVYAFVHGQKIQINDYRLLEDNVIQIPWAVSNQRLGDYSLEVMGEFNNYKWRFYDRESIFTIVNTNAEANIPPRCIIADGLYQINDEDVYLFDMFYDTHIDYVGDDYYVYKYDPKLQRYERSNIYVKGDKGDTGAKGDKGDKGDTGVTILNAIDVDVLPAADEETYGRLYITPASNTQQDDTKEEWIVKKETRELRAEYLDTHYPTNGFTILSNVPLDYRSNYWADHDEYIFDNIHSDSTDLINLYECINPNGAIFDPSDTENFAEIENFAANETYCYEDGPYLGNKYDYEFFTYLGNGLMSDTSVNLIDKVNEGDEFNAEIYTWEKIGTPNIKTIAGLSLFGSGDIKNVIIYDLANGYPSVAEIITANNNGNVVMLREVDGVYIPAHISSNSVTFYWIDDYATVTMLMGEKHTHSADTWRQYAYRVDGIISLVYGDTSDDAKKALNNIWNRYFDPYVNVNPYDTVVVCRQEVMEPMPEDPALEFLSEANTFFMTGAKDNGSNVILYFTRIDDEGCLLQFTVTFVSNVSNPTITYSAITKLDINSSFADVNNILEGNGTARGNKHAFASKKITGGTAASRKLDFNDFLDEIATYDFNDHTERANMIKYTGNIHMDIEGQFIIVNNFVRVWDTNKWIQMVCGDIRLDAGGLLDFANEFNIFWRSCDGGTFTTWEKLIRQSDLDSTMNSLCSAFNEVLVANGLSGVVSYSNESFVVS